MEPKRRGSRTYTIRMSLLDGNEPFVIEKSMAYRSACRLLDNLERTWRQIGSRIARTRSKLVLGEGRHKLLVWLEEDKHDKA